MRLVFVLFFVFLGISVNAQRYLTPIFPSLDSIIGGIYGTSMNVQSINQDLLYDFYQPQGDILAERPLIIYIHGGGFTTGTRTYPSVKKMCRDMAQKGYIVATIDYRLDPNFDIYNSNSDRRAMTDAMQDAKQAIRYFKANASTFKVDTNKVFIGGESAGAVTSMMATYVDKQSEMAIYPMANPNDPIGSTANLNVGNDVAATMCLCGFIMDTNAMEISNDKPLLWVHSTNDSFVPISISLPVVARAQNIGLPLQTKIYNGGVHCPWYYGNPNWNIYLDSITNEITNFLYPLVDPNLSLESIDQNDIFDISPNPARDFVQINVHSPISEFKVSIISVEGKTIQTQNFQVSQNLKMDVKSLSPGTYFILLESDKIVKSKKIILQ